MTNRQPDYRTRVLLTLLKQSRDDRGVSTRTLATELGVNASTVSRWDAGSPVPTLADVTRQLDALEVAGDERATILELAERAEADTWLEGTPGVSQQLAAVMDAERDAHAVVEYNPLVIPGLLQTGDYAHQTFHPSVSPSDRQLRVMMRLGRRDALVRRENPTQLLALIGEPAIRGRLGGPLVMLDQLRKVVELAALPTVTVQVVSVSTEAWHPGYLPGFYVYEFRPGLPAMIYVEHLTFGEFLIDVQSDKARVQPYLDAVPWLRQVAYSPNDSMNLIADRIKMLEAGQHDPTVAHSVSEPERRGVRADRP